jgi:hypothetical protein
VVLPSFEGFRALLRHDCQSFSSLGLETNEAALWRAETVEGTKVIELKLAV